MAVLLGYSQIDMHRYPWEKNQEKKLKINDYSISDLEIAKDNYEYYTNNVKGLNCKDLT